MARKTASRTNEIDSETGVAPDMLEKIRARAFELYKVRGRTDGSSEEDWLRAECEILGKGES